MRLLLYFLLRRFRTAEGEALSPPRPRPGTDLERDGVFPLVALEVGVVLGEDPLAHALGGLALAVTRAEVLPVLVAFAAAVDLRGEAHEQRAVLVLAPDADAGELQAGQGAVQETTSFELPPRRDPGEEKELERRWPEAYLTSVTDSGSEARAGVTA